MLTHRSQCKHLSRLGVRDFGRGDSHVAQHSDSVRQLVADVVEGAEGLDGINQLLLHVVGRVRMGHNSLQAGYQLGADVVEGVEGLDGIIQLIFWRQLGQVSESVVDGKKVSMSCDRRVATRASAALHAWHMTLGTRADTKLWAATIDILSRRRPCSSVSLSKRVSFSILPLVKLSRREPPCRLILLSVVSVLLIFPRPSKEFRESGRGWEWTVGEAWAPHTGACCCTGSAEGISIFVGLSRTGLRWTHELYKV